MLLNLLVIRKSIIYINSKDGPFIYDTLTWEDEFNSNSLNNDLNRK
jgi:hypothetical protein